MVAIASVPHLFANVVPEDQDFINNYNGIVILKIYFILIYELI